VLVGESRLSAPEPERVRPGFGRQRSDRPHASLRSGVSSCTRFLAEIAVELAEQGIAVFLGPIGQVRDEVLHLLAGSFAQALDAAEVRRVGLDQSGIELMLANQLAQTIANCATAVVPIAICRLGQLFGLWTRSRLASEGTNLLDRADANAVGLPQSTIDGASLSHTHFGTVHK